MMSFCAMPMVAANDRGAAADEGDDHHDVMGAMIEQRVLQRTTMNTPAVTMVAAWIRALTGVGPSIASGSQV